MKNLLPRSGIGRIALLAVLYLIGTTSAVDTPWLLGDEASVACYTLKSKEDIPKPVGLEMHWTVSPPVPLDSSQKTQVKYWARVQDNFWSHSSNIALLGADYSKYYRLCLNETKGCDANGDCCIWHSNVHSCRAEGGGACEPWIKAANATDDDTGKQYTLVTHTAALEGGMEVFTQDLQLETGDWVIIAHVKIMNFQCAVGATRSSVAPVPSSSNKDTTIITVVVAVVVLLAIVGALVGAYFYLKWSATAACPKDDKVPITVFFVGIKNEVHLTDCFPETIDDALKEAHNITKAAAKKNGCYIARRIGNAHMLVSKSREKALACASQITLGFGECDWSPFFGESRVAVTSPRRRDTRASSRVTDMEKSFERSQNFERSIRSRKASAWDASQRSWRSEMSSNAPGEVDTIFHPCIGMWHGLCTIVHEEERNSYSYSGSVVDAAAEMADHAKAGQILTTAEFVDECEEDSIAYSGNFSAFGAKRLRAKKRTKYDFQQYTPPGSVPMKYMGGTKKEGEDHEEDQSEAQVVGSIAGALELSARGLTTRRCAVCAISVPELCNPGNKWGTDVHTEKVIAVVTAVERIAAGYKGDVLSVTDGQIVVACNAITCCSAAPSRVAHIALDAVVTIQDLGFARPSCGVAVGPAVVGLLPREGDALTVMCGSVFKRARVYQTVAAFQKIDVATSANVSKDLTTDFYTQYFDFITWPEAPHTVTALVGVMGTREETAADEWMYELENCDATNPFRHINSIYTEVEKNCALNTTAVDSPPTSPTFKPANEAVADFIAMAGGERPVTDEMALAASGAGAKNMKSVLGLTEAKGMHTYASSRTALMQLVA